MLILPEEIAGKLTDEQKSEINAFLGTINTPETLTLDSILSDEKNAVLKKEIEAHNNKRAGELRTKWDAENKTTPPTTKPPEGEVSPETKAVLDALRTMQEQVAGLTTSKVVGDLQNYANEKAKDLPESMRALVVANEHSTQESIDAQIAGFSTAITDYQKTIDYTPNQGKTDNVSSVIKELVAEKTAAITTEIDTNI